MTDPRDALAALIQDALDGDSANSGRVAFGEYFGERTAGKILARWRLVPIEPEQIGQLFRNPHTGSVFRRRINGKYTPIMLGDQPARGAQLSYEYTSAMAGPLVPYTVADGCACGRTDQHGPHED